MLHNSFEYNSFTQIALSTKCISLGNSNVILKRVIRVILKRVILKRVIRVPIEVKNI